MASEAQRPAGALRERAARGTIVNAVFMIGVQALTLVKAFVVAAFLSRTEYGVWGVLVIALGTLYWLKQAAIGDKYIQQDERDQELAFQKAFTLELIFSSALWALLLIALPLFALIYDTTEILAPGLVLTLAVPALALQAPLWIPYRRMQFLRQRVLQSVDPIVGFIVTVALAIAGLGYWSLVIGVVAGSWAGALVAIASSPVALRLRFEHGTAREYVGFSWPIILATASGVAIAQLSILVGETTLGLAGAGAITLAGAISLYTDKVDEIVTNTLYPAIAAVRDRTELLFETFVKSNRLALMWGVPFGAALALFAPDLVEFALGERWEPAVGLIQAFGVIAAFNHVGFNWTAFFRARGETRPLAVVGVIGLVTFCVVALPLLAVEGLSGLAIGMGVVTAVTIAARAFYLTRLFPGFQMFWHLLRAFTPTIPAVACVLVLRALDSGERTLGLALGELALYLTVTAAATFALERPLLREVVGYLRGGGAGPGAAQPAASSSR